MNTKTKIFSLRYKLVLLFGLLILAAGIILGFLAVRTARKAVIEKIEVHLTDKATDVAEIVDGRLSALMQFIEGLARMPFLRDSSLSLHQQAQALAVEAERNPKIDYFGICDLQGNRYDASGTLTRVNDRVWFQSAAQGKNYITEPFLSHITNNMQILFAVPIFDNTNTIIGVLSAAAPAKLLSQEISDIVVGTSGECYILGLTGTTGASLSVGNGITLKDYPGFEYDRLEPASPTIAADGSTVVKVYYKQNVVTITLKVDGGTGGSDGEADLFHFAYSVISVVTVSLLLFHGCVQAASLNQPPKLLSAGISVGAGVCAAVSLLPFTTVTDAGAFPMLCTLNVTVRMSFHFA